MPHLEVLVDGEPRFTGEVPEHYLPSNPELFPQALGVDNTAPPTPLARLMMLTALTELLRRTLEAPLLQPLQVQWVMRGPGAFTLTVDQPG